MPLCALCNDAPAQCVIVDSDGAMPYCYDCAAGMLVLDVAFALLDDARYEAVEETIMG
jgi:hypothetical protein